MVVSRLCIPAVDNRLGNVTQDGHLELGNRLTLKVNVLDFSVINFNNCNSFIEDGDDNRGILEYSQFVSRAGQLKTKS